MGSLWTGWAKGNAPQVRVLHKRLGHGGGRSVHGTWGAWSIFWNFLVLCRHFVNLS